jgi:urease accessory protein
MKGMRMKRHVASVAAVFVLLFSATAAFAHPGHDTGPAGAAGFAHPFSGWDHLLAMIAVGLWATQLGGRAKWLVPASFLAAMLLGGALAAADVTVRLAEQGVLTSVLVLGVLVAIAARLPLAAAAAIVGLFAIFHGYAHVSDMRPRDALSAYAPGFLLSTALLNLAGLGLGTLLQKAHLNVLTRICGGVVAIAAVALWITAA